MNEPSIFRKSIGRFFRLEKEPTPEPKLSRANWQPMPCSTPAKRRAWSRLAMTAFSVISKHTCPGVTPVLSRHSTTNSRNCTSPRVCPEILMATLRLAASASAPPPQGPGGPSAGPAIDEPHEAVALGGAHKVRRRDIIALFVAHAHEHFHCRAAAVRAVGGHDD